MALTAIGLDDVKRLKNATGTTVNDVILAVCTGALRSFLVDGDELPDKPLVAVVPVSVRPDIDSPKGSNQVSSMFVQLPGQPRRPPRPPAWPSTRGPRGPRRSTTPSGPTCC